MLARGRNTVYNPLLEVASNVRSRRERGQRICGDADLHAKLGLVGAKIKFRVWKTVSAEFI